MSNIPGLYQIEADPSRDNQTRVQTFVPWGGNGAQAEDHPSRLSYFWVTPLPPTAWPFLIPHTPLLLSIMRSPTPHPPAHPWGSGRPRQGPAPHPGGPPGLRPLPPLPHRHLLLHPPLPPPSSSPVPAQPSGRGLRPGPRPPPLSPCTEAQPRPRPQGGLIPHLPCGGGGSSAGGRSPGLQSSPRGRCPASSCGPRTHGCPRGGPHHPLQVLLTLLHTVAFQTPSSASPIGCSVHPVVFSTGCGWAGAEWPATPTSTCTALQASSAVPALGPGVPACSGRVGGG